ncbi:MAG TPA: aspartate aminotransferase family protein [Thermomicrobiales bacterium]|nr:aspartate aminotransferase family protein [Thermomicrobiales bacterium]
MSDQSFPLLPYPKDWIDDQAELLARHQDALFPSVGLSYSEPIELRYGERQYVYDGSGRQYLDFFGGIVTTSSGHAIPEITEPIKEQLDRIIHSSTLFLIRAQIELAERIKAMTPAKLNKVFFTNSGTEANEAAFLITTLNRSSNELIALRHSYHGRSFATNNASGQRGWRSSTLSPLHVHYVGNPYCYRCPWEKTYPSCGMLCARDVEQVITTVTSGNPAAFIAEPIQGVGGFVTPPVEYFPMVSEILTKHGIPFIADEVQSAWGRTGVADFGFQAYNVEPDVVVFAKGLANGVPIGGLIATDDLAGSIKSLSLSTFGGNPIATTAAMANLNYMATHRLRENALNVGRYFRQRLEELQARHVVIGDVRGMGLMQALEFVTDRTTKEPATAYTARLMDETKRRGLLVGKGGLYANIFRISPPMIVDCNDVDEAVRILDESLTATPL